MMQIEDIEDEEMSTADDPAIVPATEAEIDVHGKRHGGWNGTYLLLLTDAMWDALREGQAVAAGINGHEYGIGVMRMPR